MGNWFRLVIVVGLAYLAEDTLASGVFPSLLKSMVR